MSEILHDPPSESEDHPRLWQTFIPLGIAMAAAVVGYYLFGQIKAADYGNFLEFMVLGCFVLFSAVFIILNKEITSLDEKATAFRIRMADALAESKALNRQVGDETSEHSE